MISRKVHIVKVAVATGEAIDTVRPGRSSSQSVDVWHYPQNYTRRIEVRTKPSDTDPLVYQQKGVGRVKEARESRDSALSTKRSEKLFWTFEFKDFQLEHEDDRCPQAPSSHTITASALSAKTTEYRTRRGQGIPRSWMSTDHTVQCESRPD